jgi:Spy/CpxP family protein refolding chaperone
MRKLQFVLAALLLVATATTASAQERRSGGGNRMTTLLQGITLTAEQQAKVDTLAQKANAAMQAVRADTALGEGRRARIMELMDKQTEDVKCLLTDGQRKVFDKNLADLQARIQQSGGRPPQR